MNFLTLEDMLRLHFQIIEDFGGHHGVRDEGRLQSVVAATTQEVFGQEQCPSIYEKAAVYMRNIIADHPFVDGNKRSAITCTGILLMQNRFHLTAKPEDLEDFAVRVAVEHLDVPVIVSWLEAHSRMV